MDETTQFLVQWDEHPSHLATRLGYLLEHQSLVDVTLMCNTHTLKVHRAVLAACSPYFERQLGNHPLIVLKDMKFSVLKSLVEFMYCGETSVSEENLSSLLEAAKFFEVKGLSSMTKETVRGPNSSNAIKSFNGPITPTTSAPYGRNCGGRGGRGRGRGRPPANNPTTKIGSPTESAQILLSLSGNNPPAPTTASTPSPQLYTTSKNVKIDTSLIQQASGATSSGTSSSPASFNSIDKSKMAYEPRRRGRKRGAMNLAFRDRLLRDSDQMASLETLKRDLSDDSDQMCSPLLNSLLTKGEGKKAAAPTATVSSPSSSSSSSPRVSDPNDNSKYFQALKEFGLPTNVPILMDNGEGKYVTLNEDVLKSVIESDGNLQFQVTDSALVDSQGFLNQVVTTDKKECDERFVNKQKKAAKPFVVQEVQISRSDDEDKEIGGVKMKTEIQDENDIINEDLFEDIKTGAATEAEMVPDAVVLFEVTDNKKIEKYVVSAREVSMLKSLNEQLTKQNKELADITADAKIDVVGSNTKVAELKVKIGRTRSILSKFVNCTQGLQERLKNVAKMYMNGNSNPSKLSQSQVVQLEFIDGNGEKIEGYQVQGTVVDKRLSETKEVRHKDNDLLGLFDIVCSGSEGAIMDKKRGGKGGSTMLSGRGDDVAKEMSYQMVMNNNLTDHHETINYDQIEAMIEDPAGNIVIEDKNQDLKYIIDNEGNLMNHDDNYVVYEEDKGDLGGGEYVIYDNHDGVIPDMTDGDNSRGFVVGAETEVIQNDDGTEYIVYDGSKGELSDHIKEMSDGDVGSQYIVYTSEEAMDKPPDEYDGIEEGDELSKEHQEFVMNEGELETVIVKEEMPETNGEVNSMEGESPVKDVPFAVGLLPLKDALEKFQSISDHQPRKTRSDSIGSRRRSSVNSDSSDRSIGSKKVKLDPTLAESVEGESL